MPDFPPFRYTPPVAFSSPSITSAYAGTGLRRRSSIRLRIFRNRPLDTATSGTQHSRVGFRLALKGTPSTSRFHTASLAPSNTGELIKVQPGRVSPFTTTVVFELIIHWSLTTLREKLVKIGAKVVRHGRYVTFQLEMFLFDHALNLRISSDVAVLVPHNPDGEKVYQWSAFLSDGDVKVIH